MSKSARILVLDENISVPLDRRVWLESRALKEAGHDVIVVCPRGETRDTEPRIVIEGIEIHRFPLRHAKGGPLDYGREYAVAAWSMMRLARRLNKQATFDVVHLCNPPDVLITAALPLKLQGARIVFDHHDLVPELFLSRFGDGKAAYRVLRVLERTNFSLVDAVIATNDSYRKIALTRGRVPEERVAVVRTGPDLDRFVPGEPELELRRGKTHLLCYVGIMGPQDGVDYALRAISVLRREIGRDDFHAAFVGFGSAQPDMVALASALEIDDVVEFPGFLEDEGVLRYLSSADVCLAPEPKTAFNDVSTMTKWGEYMAMRRPIVAFELAEARVACREAAVYAPRNDEREYARLINQLLDDPARRKAMGAIGRERVETELSWNRSRERLIDFYDRLLALPHRRVLRRISPRTP